MTRRCGFAVTETTACHEQVPQKRHLLDHLMPFALRDGYDEKSARRKVVMAKSAPADGVLNCAVVEPGEGERELDATVAG